MGPFFKCMSRDNASTISIKSKCFDKTIVFNLENDDLVIEVLDVIKKRHENTRRQNEAKTDEPTQNLMEV